MTKYAVVNETEPLGQSVGEVHEGTGTVIPHLSRSAVNILNRLDSENTELKKKNIELHEEIYSLQLTLDLVVAKELKAVDTLDLLEELYYRVQGLEKTEKNYLKLLKKHERASRLIAELKRGETD